MITSVAVNLMVTDMVASLQFYSEVLGAELAFTVDAEQNTEMPGAISEAVVFASVRAAHPTAPHPKSTSGLRQTGGVGNKDSMYS